MQKLIVAGLMAAGCIALSQNHASAWVNSKFGVGLNWDFSSGGNTWGWGAIRNGQIPGPDVTGGYAVPYGAPRYGAAVPQGMVPSTQGMVPTPQGFAPQANVPQNNSPSQPNRFDVGQSQQPYAGGYESPFHFANYARPAYYVPSTRYYYNGR